MHIKTEASQSTVNNLTRFLDIPGLPSLMIDYLSPHDVVAASTNKKLNVLMNDPKYWKRLIKKHFPKYYESHIEILEDLPETKESKSTLDFKKIYIVLYKAQRNEYYKMLWMHDDVSYKEALEPADSTGEDFYPERYWKSRLESEFNETKTSPKMGYKATYAQKFKEKHAVYVRLLWLLKDFTADSFLSSENIGEILTANGFHFRLFDHRNWCDDNSLLSAIINTKNQNLLNYIYICAKKFFTNAPSNIITEIMHNYGRTLFFWAAVLNQPQQEINELIKLNPLAIYEKISTESMNDSNEHLNNILSYLATYGHKDLYIYLKKKGAPYRNAPIPAIHLACKYGNADLVKYLAEQEPAAIYSLSRASSTSLTPQQTPFEVAAAHGQLEALNILFDIHHEILDPTPEEKKPKYKLNREKLPEGKTFPNPLKRESGHTLFHSAAIEGHYKIIKRLQKESGSDINSFFRLWNGDRQTALHVALKYGPSGFKRSPLFIRYLLNTPGNDLANININGNLNYLAARDGFIDILKEFLQRQDCVWWGVTDAEGSNLLHYAAKHIAPNNLKLLLETNKINSDLRNAEFTTPLEIALDKSVISGFKVLFIHQLKQFSNEQERRQFLYQPQYVKSHTFENVKFSFLGYAVAYNNLSLLKFLLPFYLPKAASAQQKTDFFNQKFDNRGSSLLHIAFYFRNIEMMEWLMHNHADINAVDEQGFPILFQSVIKYNKEIFDLLLSKGADLYFITQTKKNLLHFLLESEFTDDLIAGKLKAIFETASLSKIPGFINQSQANGKTPLHIAVENNQLESATVILETGAANLKLRDQNGLTPLQLAIKKQNWTMTNLIEKHLNSITKACSYQPIDNNKKGKMEEKEAKTDFFKAPKAVAENTTPSSPTKPSTQEKRKHEETEPSETESTSHKKPKKVNENSKKQEREDRSYLLDPML